MQTILSIAEAWARLYALHMLEFSAFVLLLWMIDRVLRLPVATRYGLWLLALVKLFVPPVFHLPAVARDSAVGQISFPDLVASPVASAGSAFAWPLLFFLAWVLTALGIAGLIAWQNMRLRRSLRHARPVHSSEFSAALTQDSTSLHLLESDRIEVPVLIGLLSPRLYLPSHFRTWSREQQHSILAHELAHVRSGDLWLLLLQNIALALFAWNPLVWFLHRRLLHLRELRCDAAAIQHTGTDPVAYGKFLLSILDAQRQPRAAAWTTGIYFAETKTTLKQRFQHLLTQTGGQMPMKRAWHSILIAAMALALVPFSWQCNQEDPAISIDTAAVLETMAEEGISPYDHPPEPVGGIRAIQQVLHYPDIARKAGIEDRVVIKVLVAEDGTVNKTEVLQAPKHKNTGLEEAAIEAVKRVEWLPAKLNGKPVESWVAIPVIFKLNVTAKSPKSPTAPKKTPHP